MSSVEACPSVRKTPHIADEKNDYVFKLLSDESNWTENILTDLMRKSLIPPVVIPEKDEQGHRSTLFAKMAVKFLWMLHNSKRIRAKSGQEPWIPTQSCVDLTTLGAALTREEERLSLDDMRTKWSVQDINIRTGKRTPRHFINCLGCDKRFLAKRANNLTCSPRCRLKAYRKSKDVTD